MAAIAFDAAATGVDVTASSATWSHTCTGTSGLLVVVTLAATNTLTGVTYNSVAMTQIGSAVQNSSNLFFAQMWYLIGPTTGANNVVVSASGSIRIGGSSASYTGVKPTGQPDATASGTTQTLSVTTIADKCWCVIGMSPNAAPATADGSTTGRATANTIGILIGDNNAAKTPAGSVTLGTSVGAAWAGHIASFSPASATGGMFLVF